MKTKMLLVGFIIAIFSMSYSEEIPYQVIRKNFKRVSYNYRPSQRDQEIGDAPAYSFSIQPIDLGGTIYDYMPGSYCDSPIRIQPDQTDTGYSAGGIYILFHNQISGNEVRRVNYAYISPNGFISGSGRVSEHNNIREGYPGFAIDTESANPFVAYHLDVDGDNVLDDEFSYDNYAMAGLAGLWINPPFVVINNTQLQNSGIIQEGDEFIWPYVHIGASPIEGKKRVYVSTNNSNNSTGEVGYPSENVLLAYADFDRSDIDASSPATWNWQYRTIRQFDDWHNENPEWARPHKTFLVKDNYVIYVGEVIYNSEISTTTPKLFALVNDNYGEGDFTYYEFDYQNEWPINDVQNNDNSTWLYGGNSEKQLTWTLFLSEHFNAIITDDNIVSFAGVLAIQYFDPEENNWYIDPSLGHCYTKEFTFNLQTQEFGVQDVYPPDLSETPNNTPVVPWDLNGDGIVDGYNQDGYPEWIPSLPVFHTNLDKAFDYNLVHITKSSDDAMEAMVWSDCYEAWLEENGFEGYEDWAETSKIMIATKVDGKWRTPITIDANTNDVNYNAAIDGMIPCYVYPGDKIQVESNDTARLHLFFLNDDSYGSSVMGEGATPNPDNCRLEYAAIDFSTLSTKTNQVTPIENFIETLNYPNPFNPRTTIKYKLKKSGRVELNIYNIKGELVRNLIDNYQNSGEHQIVWTGINYSGMAVPSGIYFYKIKQGKYTATKKMILMK